jgi:hypothetical protein
MAIEQGTETVAVTTEERTLHVTIDTPKGGDPTVMVFREIVRTTPDGAVLSKQDGAIVQRSLSQVAEETFAVGDKTYTGAEIAALISAVADTWRQQEIAAAAAS